MTNLLEETREDIQSSGYAPDDVAWVGSRDGSRAVSWQAFERVADVTYDSGYGGQEIARDLVVVFRDGSWLERSEYDGSEWWTHHLTPTRKPDAEPFTTVHNGDTYASVWEMNRPGGKYAEDEA